MTVQEILGALSRRVWLLGFVSVLCGALGVLVPLIHGPSYQAVSQVVLTQPETAVPGPEGLLTAQKLNLVALSYAQIVQSHDFVRRAAAQAGVTGALPSVTAAVQQNTSVLTITVSASSARPATDVASALDTALNEAISVAGSAARATLAAVVVQSPEAHRSSADPVFLGIVGFVIGLAVVSTIVLLAADR